MTKQLKQIRAQNRKEFTAPPKGYRLLRWGTQLKCGDKVFLRRWTNSYSWAAGDVVNCAWYARKIK